MLFRSEFTNVSFNSATNRITIPVLNGNTVTVDSFDTATCDMAKYIVKIKNTTHNSVSGSEMILVHDGTDIFMNEYGIVHSSTPNGYFSSQMSGSTINVLFTPINDDNMTISVFKFYG